MPTRIQPARFSPFSLPAASSTASKPPNSFRSSATSRSQKTFAEHSTRFVRRYNELRKSGLRCYDEESRVVAAIGDGYCRDAGARDLARRGIARVRLADDRTRSAAPD